MLAKQRVAASAPERVVDLAKAVDVDQVHSTITPPRASLRAGAEPFKSRAPAGQCGQRVLGCTVFLDCKILGCELAFVFRAAIERAHHISACARGCERAKPRVTPRSASRPHSRSIAATKPRWPAQMNHPMIRPRASCNDCIRPPFWPSGRDRNEGRRGGYDGDVAQLHLAGVSFRRTARAIRRAPVAGPYAVPPRPGPG